MADGIGNVNGFSNSYNFYARPRKEETTQEEHAQQAPVQDYTETQVDPSKVMDFLAGNNYFIAPTTKTGATTPVELDAAAKDRISNYMEQFESIYAVVRNEFGDELAPTVMDMVMDSLMGM